MKRRFFQCLKKIRYLCLFVFGCFVFSLFTSTSVSGISVEGTVGFTPSASSSITINGNTNINFSNSTLSDGRRSVSTIRSGTISINRVVISYSGTGVTVSPPGVLNGSFSFYITTQGTNSFTENSVAIRSQPYGYINRDFYSVLHTNCYSHDYDPLGKSLVIDCDYSIFVTPNINVNYFALAMDIEISNTSTDYYYLTTFLQSASFTKLNFSSLSDSDKQWLNNNISAEVEEGQKAANNDVKVKTESASTDASTEANTQGGDSATQGQTLLQAFSGFVTAITNVSPASDCIENVDLSGYHQDLVFNVDLCQNALPSGLTFVGTILLILMVVPLSIFTVRRMISLFRSFQS